MIYCHKQPKLRPQEVESKSINHGGHLNTCINNSFGIPIENMKNDYNISSRISIRCNLYETNSDFDNIILLN